MPKVVYEKQDLKIHAEPICGDVQFTVRCAGYPDYRVYVGKLHKPWWKFWELTVEDAKQLAIKQVDKMCAAWDRDRARRADALRVIEEL